MDTLPPFIYVDPTVGSHTLFHDFDLTVFLVSFFSTQRIYVCALVLYVRVVRLCV